MASREEDPSSGVLEGGAENAAVPADRVFEAKPVWQRMIIILAGVTLNVVFAWIIFVGLAAKNGYQYDPTVTVGTVRAAELPPEAAALGSVVPGTRILSLDGEPVTAWDDITSRITHSAGDVVAFTFDNHEPITIALHRDQLVERSQLANAIRPLHPAVVGTVLPSTPAARAGLEVDDSLVAIDGQEINQWNDAVALIEAAPDRTLSLVILRDGERIDVPITPSGERSVADDSLSVLVGKIGVRPRVPYLSDEYTLGEAVRAGTSATWTAAGTILRTVRGLFTGRVSSRELGGPILIGQLAAESARAGIDVLLAFMALISVNLAVVNLLPVPVLDGGAFLLLLAEGITRRQIPVKVREVIQLVGLLLVVLLMVLAFSNDIARLLGR
jgi:regulator of sigma E protease